MRSPYRCDTFHIAGQFQSSQTPRKKSVSGSDYPPSMSPSSASQHRIMQSSSWHVVSIKSTTPHPLTRQENMYMKTHNQRATRDHRPRAMSDTTHTPHTPALTAHNPQPPKQPDRLFLARTPTYSTLPERPIPLPLRSRPNYRIQPIGSRGETRRNWQAGRLSRGPGCRQGSGMRAG